MSDTENSLSQIIEGEDFTDIQKYYLRGFAAGIMPVIQSSGMPASAPLENSPQTVYGTPIEDLCKEELIKHEQHGLDCYDTFLANTAQKQFPQGGDIFRYKYHGLFYVTPAQESFMLRARIAGGVITSSQLRGIAHITRSWGNGYSDITTRANLQIREIMPENAQSVIEHLTDLGLTSQGSGADNVRNITATPTSGFDAQEVIDVIPYARRMHHYIMKNRDMYGLPRKFNIAFDSGGLISVCADTNDIGFYAVKVADGIFFRMQLCGITGHKQFASDCGLLIEPDQSIAVAAALIRVFIEHGDRTNRKKARLKYLVDEWGVTKLLDEVQKKLSFPLVYSDEGLSSPSYQKSKRAHLGIHPQKNGLFYIGLVIPAARISAEQMQVLSDIADTYGQGELRLTVWQNLLIPHISEESLAVVQAKIKAINLHVDASALSSGMVACTGSRGCKYAAADTKGHSLLIGKHLDQKIQLDQPINIHLTGCNHSCAQHYIGDIGMMGVKVKN